MDNTHKSREPERKRRPSGEKRQASGEKTRKATPARRQPPRQEKRKTSSQAREGRRRDAELEARQRAQQEAQQRQAQARQGGEAPAEEVYSTATEKRRTAREDAASRMTPKKSGAKQKRSVFTARAQDPEAARNRANSANRNRSAARQEKKVIRPPKKNAPAVIYTQPTPFHLNRFLVRLLTVTAVVLALTMGLSVFFRVEHISVSGANAYSVWTVSEASGIEKGESLLTFSRARAGARIRAELPYVEQVRFGIKLPNTVIIDIVELDVVYAIQATDGMWWFITSGGRVVEQTDGGTAADYTRIKGIELQSPSINQMAVVAELAVPEGTEETVDELDQLASEPVVTNADRLAVALQILEALEANDIVGEIGTVDVADLGNIELWYGEQYQVQLGNQQQIEKKIADMNATVAKLDEFQMGEIDVSYTIWPDKVVFTPFVE